MLVVISPAKKLDMSKKQLSAVSQPLFPQQTQELVGVMQSLDPERLKKLKEIASCESLPFYIMTSPINHEETASFFKENDFLRIAHPMSPLYPHINLKRGSLQKLESA